MASKPVIPNSYWEKLLADKRLESIPTASPVASPSPVPKKQGSIHSVKNGMHFTTVYTGKHVEIFRNGVSVWKHTYTPKASDTPSMYDTPSPVGKTLVRGKKYSATRKNGKRYNALTDKTTMRPYDITWYRKEEGNPVPVVFAQERVYFRSISQATAFLRKVPRHCEYINIRISPAFDKCSLGDSIIFMANYAYSCYRNSELRNNSTTMTALKRTFTEIDDCIGDATLTLMQCFRDNPDMDGFTAMCMASTAIRKRTSAYWQQCNTGELNPNWTRVDVYPSIKHSMCLDMDKLVFYATESASLTDTQKEVLERKRNGEEMTRIAGEMGISRKNCYKSLYRAYYHIVQDMVKNDSDYSTFERVGLTKQDVQYTLALLAKRGEIK